MTIKKLIAIGLLFFIVSSLSKTLFDYQKNYSFYQEYKEEYEIEKKRNIELNTMIVRSKDTFEFEKMVRNKLNLHKENERIIIIPNPTPTIFEPTPTPQTVYEEWVDVFFTPPGESDAG
ncbi:MAG: septum formation initiator family protein [Weeksellaceae bacterium]